MILEDSDLSNLSTKDKGHIFKNNLCLQVMIEFSWTYCKAESLTLYIKVHTTHKEVVGEHPQICKIKSVKRFKKKIKKKIKQGLFRKWP